MNQSDSLVDRGMIVRAICEIRKRKRRWFKENGGEGSGVRKQCFFIFFPKAIWQVSIFFFKIICHHPPFLSHCELTDKTFLLKVSMCIF